MFETIDCELWSTSADIIKIVSYMFKSIVSVQFEGVEGCITSEMEQSSSKFSGLHFHIP